MAIKVDDFKAFWEDVRKTPRRTQAAVRKVFRTYARTVVNRAVADAPGNVARVASHTRTTESTKGVTITWTRPFAGVLEFAKTFARPTRGGGNATVHIPGTSARTIERGGSRMGDPPRFAYKAWAEIEPKVANDALDKVVDAIAATG